MHTAGHGAARAATGRTAVTVRRHAHPAATDLTTTERSVLAVVTHPRYRGAYLPVWRILEAAAGPLTPSVVRRTLEHLEAVGRVERRRLATRVEWRSS
jgi:hypothetical protein